MAFALFPSEAGLPEIRISRNPLSERAGRDGMEYRAHRHMYRSADDPRRYRGRIDAAENSVAEWK